MAKQVKDAGRTGEERTAVRDRAGRTEGAEMRRVTHVLVFSQATLRQ